MARGWSPVMKMKVLHVLDIEYDNENYQLKFEETIRKVENAKVHSYSESNLNYNMDSLKVIKIITLTYIYIYIYL